jgi:hypothetical protein
MKTWTERIEDAEIYGSFTLVDIKAAGTWVTCACGEQDTRIPRAPVNADTYEADTYEYAPLDPTLRKLGMDFYAAVGHHDTVAARRILRAIEARAAVIVAGLKA